MEKKLSVEAFVKEQIKRWDAVHSDADKKGEAKVPVITVCMEPGSGGRRVAEEIAKQLGFDFFYRDIVQEIAKSADISATILESIEKERLSGIQDFISSLVNDHYLYPGLYLEHLMEVVNAIAAHGQAVIVGRGANFILPPESRFSVLVVAPLEKRIQNVVHAFGTSEKEAKRRVLQRESKRQAFVRESFHADIFSPLNYDLVVNMGRLNVESAVEAVIGAVIGRISNK
ncbi:MAG: hypothetical protein B6245_11640 [Desulfobacteraceae bacterium 4572_88]|nr:MAG: hypothetical protein B6245_11640 [Desulfobacteraceae bacterium 4572_88]